MLELGGTLLGAGETARYGEGQAGHDQCDGNGNGESELWWVRRRRSK